MIYPEKSRLVGISSTSSPSAYFSPTNEVCPVVGLIFKICFALHGMQYKQSPMETIPDHLRLFSYLSPINSKARDRATSVFLLPLSQLSRGCFVEGMVYLFFRLGRSVLKRLDPFSEEVELMVLWLIGTGTDREALGVGAGDTGIWKVPVKLAVLSDIPIPTVKVQCGDDVSCLHFGLTVCNLSVVCVCLSV